MGREPRDHIHSVFRDADSLDEPDDGNTEGRDSAEGDEACMFMLDTSSPASTYAEEFTYIFLAGDNRFAIPEEAVKPAGKICWSCGSTDHLSNKCLNYNASLPHASAEQKARFSRNINARSRLVFSNHGVDGKNISKSGNKVGRSSKGSQ